jgi:putative membrane protein
MKKALRMTILGLAAWVVGFRSVLGQVRGYGRGPGMMGWGYGGGWGWWIFMVIFWLAVLIGIIALIRWLWVAGGRTSRQATQDSALDILKKRYARGEINKEEFEQKKKDLGS